MSVRFMATVFCHGGDCESKIQGYLAPGDDPTEIKFTGEITRDYASYQGWTRDGDRDYCPECSKRRATAMTDIRGIVGGGE